ncbi:MAG TPA: hypothetical protein VLA46_13015, partial [Saprospiraceae bacterium]|nr:hypothetical protein [Saprospiraceae bacterium]
IFQIVFCYVERSRNVNEQEHFLMKNQKKSVLRVKIPVVERSRNDNAGSVGSENEFALLLAVTNGYIDFYSDNDFFDLTYAC